MGNPHRCLELVRSRFLYLCNFGSSCRLSVEHMTSSGVYHSFRPTCLLYQALAKTSGRWIDVVHWQVARTVDLGPFGDWNLLLQLWWMAARLVDAAFVWTEDYRTFVAMCCDYCFHPPQATFLQLP